MTIAQIERVTLRNFKSVQGCTLALGPLTILAGRNGVGKSNIIDSLRFVADALRNTLEFAIRERGGIDHVRRKSLGGRPTHPGIGVELRLANGHRAAYGFVIAAVEGGAFRVDSERCVVRDASGGVLHQFATKKGEQVMWSPASPAPAVASDRLFLVAASGTPEFRPVYDHLQRMTFHNLSPEAMKLPQRPAPGALLSHDGRNLASVIKQMEPSRRERVLEYIRAIGVPLTRIEHKLAGPLETIEVAQELAVPEGTRNMTFDAISLSDGTIRAMGILVSLLSAGPDAHDGPTLIGIEEPETALHPAASGVLMDALREGAERTQVLTTCHSPDLLDHPSVTAEMIRPVLMQDGRTRVGALDPRKAKLLQEHLSTAGELLRLDQLEPDPEDLRRQDEARDTLFESIT
jgi:predicted ATPase